MLTYKTGRALVPGDTIAIVAPAIALMTDDLEPGQSFLEGLGYKVSFGAAVHDAWGYLAGTDEARAADINAAFADPHIAAVLCLRGGYGAARLLDLLDYDMIGANPKQFIGFSDITALHIALRQRSQLATIHAPMLLSLGRRPTAYTVRQFTKGLARPMQNGPFAMPARHALQGIVPGTAKGTICGGNITVLASLIGTPYELDGRGSLLFLEDVGTDAYRIDRMFRQMELSGLIDRVNGIIFGEFTRCGPNQEALYEFTVQQILEEYAKRWQKPCLAGLPVGHGRHNGWLPVSVEAAMDVRPDGTAAFNIGK
jgi:muramoyltetrapeptide carboxypeptidase